MKSSPEHTRPFNAEHAKAGAPYCQRDGLAARIGIWDGRSHSSATNTCLIGEYEYSEGRFSATAWLSNGGNPNGTESNDLVMLPLGMCEGKPVFVGDELVDRDGQFRVAIGSYYFETCTWPRKEPMMPEIVTGCYPMLSTQFAHVATHNRVKLEKYWTELDEFNGVKK